MNEKTITVPELGIIAGTRFLLGVGAGLLLAGRFRSGQRKLVGGVLLTLGALSTIPIGYGIVYPKIIKGESDEKQVAE